MPLRGSDRLNDIIREVDAGGDPVRQYTMTNGDGRQSVSTLVACPKRSPRKIARTPDRYVAFITNARVDGPGDHTGSCQRRTASGGAETGYRILKQARAKSPRVAARLFLMSFSPAYVNFWLPCRRMRIDDAWQGTELPMVDYSDILWMYVAARGRPP